MEIGIIPVTTMESIKPLRGGCGSGRGGRNHDGDTELLKTVKSHEEEEALWGEFCLSQGKKWAGPLKMGFIIILFFICYILFLN